MSIAATATERGIITHPNDSAKQAWSDLLHEAQDFGCVLAYHAAGHGNAHDGMSMAEARLFHAAQRWALAHIEARLNKSSG